MGFRGVGKPTFEDRAGHDFPASSGYQIVNMVAPRSESSLKARRCRSSHTCFVSKCPEGFDGSHALKLAAGSRPRVLSGEHVNDV